MAFLEEFFSIVIALVDFIISLVEDLIFVVALLGQFILKIPSLIGFFPTAVVSTLIVAFSIVLIYKILGREG